MSSHLEIPLLSLQPVCKAGRHNRVEGWRGQGHPGTLIQSWPTTRWLRVAGEVSLSPLSAPCRPVNSGSRALELKPGSVTSTVLV